MKRILHISKYYYPFRGGTEQTAQDCVNALKEEFYQKVSTCKELFLSFKFVWNFFFWRNISISNSVHWNVIWINTKTWICFKYFLCCRIPRSPFTWSQNWRYEFCLNTFEITIVIKTTNNYFQSFQTQSYFFQQECLFV